MDKTVEEQVRELSFVLKTKFIHLIAGLPVILITPEDTAIAKIWSPVFRTVDRIRDHAMEGVYRKERAQIWEITRS